MSRESNIALVKKAYDCFGRADVPGILDLVAVNIDWLTPDVAGAPFHGQRNGKEGVLEFFTGLGSSETFETFETREFLADGNKVIVLGHLASVVNATGKRWESDFVHIFTCADGVITGFREFFDNVAATQAFDQTAEA